MSDRMILRHRSCPRRGSAAVPLLVVLGAASGLRPSAASAQALGTMQVTARVTPATEAWPTLAATAELAADAGVSGGVARLERGLARLELEPGAPQARLVRIRVDYLRN
jgi:hypothetical protein